jgi:hypothetical protein
MDFPARAAQQTGVAVPKAGGERDPARDAEFVRAQEAVGKILAGEEFQRAEPTWWDHQKSRMRGWLARLFRGVDRLTTSAPWVGKLLQWVLFTAAAVGLLLWVWRTVQRQRLRVADGTGPLQATGWAKEMEDWRGVAEDQAGRGAWREAIHALYWAAIVHLERQRAWRHNPARTPREYVRLLRPGSAEQRDLRGLTSALERTWYGQRPAEAAEYGEARASFERLARGPDWAPDRAGGGTKALNGEGAGLAGGDA